MEINGICVSAKEHSEFTLIKEYIISHSPTIKVIPFRNVLKNKKLLENCQFIFTVGGDGSVAWLVGTFFKTFGTVDGLKPIVPVTRPSSIGYLKQLEFGREKFLEGFEKIVNGDFSIHNRTVLKTEVFGQSFLAVNEIYIQVNPHLASFVLSIRGKENQDFQTITSTMADGIMISTPIGSTGWALSHGGEIILNEDSLQVLILGGIHSSANFVLPRDQIRVHLTLKNSTITEHVIDAYNEARLKENLSADNNPQRTLEILYGPRLILDGKVVEFGIDEITIDPTDSIPFVVLQTHTEVEKVRKLTEFPF